MSSSPIGKHGVLVLNGYGIRVQVNAGHLLAHDGIADERRTIRLPRVGHGLRRLVMIGSDGFITLEALRSTGRSVLLLFADPHCGPCTVLLPDVGRWQRERLGTIGRVFE